MDLKPNQSPLSPSNFALLDARGDCGPQFSERRTAALQALCVNGIPANTHELWRYTHAAQFKLELAAQELESGAQKSTTVLVSETRSAANSSNDGQSDSLPNDLPNAVQFLKGAAAFAALNAAQKFVADAPELATLADICDATCSDITAIIIAPGAIVKTPISLASVAQISGCGSRLLAVVVGRGAQATIVNDLSSNPAGSSKSLELERIELVLGAGCNGNFVHLQEYGDDVRFYGRHRITADRDVNFTTLHVALGSRVARLDIDLMMPHPGANVNLLGVSVVDGRRHVDFHPNQRHLAPYCRSDLFLKTVVKDKGRSVYYGYIKVSEGAQKTDAYQTNRNLVLSSDARADTIPNLEIKANDVKCSHGASVTNVGLEDRFYLESRGLPPAAAERLLVGGFVEDVLSRFNDEALRAMVSERIATRLDRTNRAVTDAARLPR